MPKRSVPSIAVPWVKPSMRIEARRALADHRAREADSPAGISLEQRMLVAVNLRSLFWVCSPLATGMRGKGVCGGS